jgi:hypothetical protein
MLVVKVELWPGGDPRRARELGRAGIANVSDLAEVSDYVAVLRDRDREQTVYVGSHQRADGFWPLIGRAAAAVGREPIAEKWQRLASLLSDRMYE